MRFMWQIAVHIVETLPTPPQNSPNFCPKFLNLTQNLFSSITQQPYKLQKIFTYQNIPLTIPHILPFLPIPPSCTQWSSHLKPDFLAHALPPSFLHSNLTPTTRASQLILSQAKMWQVLVVFVPWPHYIAAISTAQPYLKFSVETF